MAAYSNELRRLLEEVERRPHLKRDPRLASLLLAAQRHAVGGAGPTHNLRRGVAWLAGAIRLWRRVNWRVIFSLFLDIFVIVNIMWALPKIHVAGVQVFSFISLSLFGVLWALIRSEALRLIAIEVLAAPVRWSWRAFLWLGEEFSSGLHRRWREEMLAVRLAREWRQRARSERSFTKLIEFLDCRFELAPADQERLRATPNVGFVPGLLGRIGNPALRWPGDPRILPSVVHWAILHAIRAGTPRIEPAPSNGDQDTTPSASPEQAPDTIDRNELLREINALNSRIKKLQEEMEKIQAWRVNSPAEEKNQNDAIAAKKQEIHSVRKRIAEMQSSLPQRR